MEKVLNINVRLQHPSLKFILMSFLMNHFIF